MSTTVDNRVVQMTFNNKQFEKGVDDTLKTIDKLNKALKFKDASEGFDDIQDAANSLSFKKLSDNVQSLADRFSGFGIIGMKVWDKIGDAAINLVTGPFRKVASAIDTIETKVVQGGWNRALNINKASSMITNLGYEWDSTKEGKTSQTILKEGKEIANVYYAVDQAVTGTAYSLDEAALAAANFLPTIKESLSAAEQSEELTDSLRAVMGVASTYSKDFNQVAGYFQKVATAGVATKDVLGDMQVVGIDYQQTLQKYLGLSAEELKQALEDKLITYEQFRDAFLAKFGDSLDKANETYEGAMKNMNAAFSRIGERWSTPFVEGLIPIFNALRVTINGVGTAIDNSFVLNPILGAFNEFSEYASNLFTTMEEGGKWVLNGRGQKVVESITTFLHGLMYIFSSLRLVADYAITAFKNVFSGDAKKGPSFVEKFESAMKSFFDLIEKNKDKIITFFEGFFNAIKIVASIAKVLLKVFASLLKIALKIVAVIGYLVARFVNFAAEIIKVIKNSKTYNAILNLLHRAHESLSKAFERFVKTVKNIVSAFKDFVKENKFVKTAVDTLKKAFKNLDNAFSFVFNNFGHLYEKFKEFGQNSGLFDTISSLWQGALDKIQTAIDAVVGKIKDWTGLDLGNPQLSTVTDAFKNFFEWVGGKFEEFKDAAKWAVNNPSEALEQFAETVSNVKDDITQGLSDIFSGIGDAFGGFAEKIGLFKDETEKGSKALSDFTDAGSKVSAEGDFSFLETLANGLTVLGEAFEFVKDILGNVGKAIFNGLTKMFETAKDVFDIHSFKDFLSTLILGLKALATANWASAGKAIAGFFGTLAGVPALSKRSTLSNLGDALLKVAGAFLAFGYTLRLIANIPTETFDHIIDSILVILGTVTSIVLILKKLGVTFGKSEKVGKDIIKSAGVVIKKDKEGFAMQISDALLKKFGSGAQWAGLGKFLEGLAAAIATVVLSFAGLMSAMKALDDPNAFKLALTALLAILGALFLFILGVVEILKDKETLNEANSLLTVKGAKKGFAGAIASLSLFLDSIAAATIGLVSALAVVAAIEHFGDMDEAIRGLVTIMSMLLVISMLLMGEAVVLNKISNGGVDKDTAKVITSLSALIVAIASATLLLMPPLAILAAMAEADTLMNGIGGLAMVLGLMAAAIAIVMWASSKQTKDSGTGTLLSMVGLAIAIGILGKTINSLSDVEEDKLGKAIGVIVAFCIMGAILAAAVSLVENGYSAAALLIGLGASLAEAAAAIKVLGEMKLGDLIQGVIALVVIIAILGFAAALTSAIPGIKLGLGVLGGAFLTVGAGAFLLAAALYLIIKVMDEVSTNTAEFEDKIRNFMSLLVTAIGEFIVGLLEGLLNDVALIADILLKIIIAVVDWCAEHAVEIGAAIGRFFAALVVAIAAAIMVFIGDIGSAIKNALKKKKLQGSDSPMMIDLGIDIIHGFLTGCLKKVGEVIKNIGKFVGDFLAKFMGIPRELLSLGKQALSSLWDGLKDNTIISGITSAVGKIGSTITNGIQGALDFIGGIGSKIKAAFGDSENEIDEATKRYQEAYDKWQESVKAAQSEEAKALREKRSNQNVSKGDNAIVGGAYGGAAQGTTDKNGNKLTAKQYISEESKKMQQGAKDSVDAWVKQIEYSSKDGINYVVKSMLEGYEKTFTIQSKEYGDLMTLMMQKDYYGVLDFLEIHSPSKRYAWLSSMLLEGYEKGFTDNEDTVYKTLATFSENVDAIMAQDIQPTITPVLDLSTVQNGASQVGAIFAEGAKAAAELDIKSEAGRTADTLDSMSDIFNKLVFNTDSTGVEGKLDITAGLLTELLTALSTQQLVLDTGAVVGGIAPAMDKELGMRSIRVGRRV